MSNIPTSVYEGLESVTTIIHYLERNHTPYQVDCLAKILKDFPSYGLGFNVSIRKRVFKTLEWIIEHPEVDYQALDSWNIRDNKIYFKKMQMLHESMESFRLYENLDRSKMVEDVPFVRDFVSVQNVSFF